MRPHIVQLARWVGHWIFHLKRLPALFDGIDSPSYSGASSPAKTRFSIVLDYLYLFFARRMLPRNYRLWQFDTKPRSTFREYMDEPDAPFLRRRLYSTLWEDTYGMLVNDKYIFHCYCRSHRLPTPFLYGVLCDGRLFPGCSDHTGSFDRRRCDASLVVKPARGTQGAGIHFLPADELAPLSETNEGTASVALAEALTRGEFVVEAFIRQHPEMQRMNPHSVSTIRVITLLTRHQEVVPLAGILRTSASKRGTDNFSTGGIVIGIDLTTGKLNRTGFVKPGYGTTLTEHPLTHVRFQDFHIPHWPEVLQLLDRAQKSFRQLLCIGWDIAVSESGPLLIEGNIEWGTAGIQAATGGLLTKKNRALFAQHGLRFD